MRAAQTKQQLIERIDEEHARWEALLKEVRPDCLEIPGVTGQWTMKDTIAHLTTWWRREVGRLASMQRGERPIDHPSQADVAVINRWIHLVNCDRPAGAVLMDAEAAWQELRARVQALPEAVLLGGEQLDWTEGRPAGVAVVDDFLRHFHEEHEEPIRKWLDALPSR